MPKYIIEREIPGAGNLTPEQLREVSQKSNTVLNNIGSVQWQHSYVTDDKIYCVYIAPNPELVKKHAVQCEIPANSIYEIRAVIDPATAE